MRYRIKAEYHCEHLYPNKVRTPESIEIEASQPPEVGPSEDGPLKHPDCRLYLGIQSCEDTNCQSQTVLEVKAIN